MRERGCSGLTYTMNYIKETDKKAKFDEEVTTNGNTKILFIQYFLYYKIWIYKNAIIM